MTVHSWDTVSTCGRKCVNRSSCNVREPKEGWDDQREVRRNDKKEKKNWNMKTSEVPGRIVLSDRITRVGWETEI